MLGIACSVFRKEIGLLREKNQIDIQFNYLDSNLHMHPDLLDQQLQKAVGEKRQDGEEIILVYGDCCPHMHELNKESYIERVCGMNCYEILLGKDQYRELSSKGAFFLMPEWVHQWQKVFQDQLGLGGDLTRPFMTEYHTKLAYLDTGLAPIPEKLLDEISEYCGLPIEIIPVALDHLLALILDARKRVNSDE